MSIYEDIPVPLSAILVAFAYPRLGRIFTYAKRFRGLSPQLLGDRIHAAVCVSFAARTTELVHPLIEFSCYMNKQSHDF